MSRKTAATSAIVLHLMKYACPIVCSRSSSVSIRVLSVSSIVRRFTPSTLSLKSSGRGIISTKLNRRRSAVSISAIERSAVFIVPSR